MSQFLRPVKSNIPLQSAGVYKLDCDCGLSYISQTKRSIGVKVHLRYQELAYIEISCVWAYCSLMKKIIHDIIIFFISFIIRRSWVEFESMTLAQSEATQETDKRLTTCRYKWKLITPMVSIRQTLRNQPISSIRPLHQLIKLVFL